MNAGGALTPEPFLAMMTFVELPLLKRALQEISGAEALKVRLRDLSAFTDADLNWMMEGVAKSCWPAARVSYACTDWRNCSRCSSRETRRRFRKMRAARMHRCPDSN
jgi:hypothetical protein